MVRVPEYRVRRGEQCSSQQAVPAARKKILDKAKKICMIHDRKTERCLRSDGMDQYGGTQMLEKLIKYLSTELDIPAEELNRDTTFESLHLDSLDTVEMLMDLESELGVDLELEEKVATLGELADFIESKLD